MRVALVDDDPSIRTVTRLVLASTGRATLVAEADAADTAERALADSAPDVVLLDRDLGRSSGLDLVPLVRRTCPSAMVAVFSSLPAADAEAEALAAGADHYYEKWLLGDALLDRVEADLVAHRDVANRGAAHRGPTAR